MAAARRNESGANSAVASVAGMMTPRRPYRSNSQPKTSAPRPPAPIAAAHNTRTNAASMVSARSKWKAISAKSARPAATSIAPATYNHRRRWSGPVLRGEARDWRSPRWATASCCRIPAPGAGGPVSGDKSCVGLWWRSIAPGRLGSDLPIHPQCSRSGCQAPVNVPSRTGSRNRCAVTIAESRVRSARPGTSRATRA